MVCLDGLGLTDVHRLQRPEYRLHSILFAVRSLLAMGIVWLEHCYVGLHINTLVNMGLVLATLVIATKVSEFFPSGGTISGGTGGGTIRDLEAPAWLKTFFSNMQFHLSAICLVGVSRFSLNFMSVWIIQFTVRAFPMPCIFCLRRTYNPRHS
jgi:hypothetical protein